MKANNLLLIKTSTWSRDSHGLYDYESRHITRNCLRTLRDSKLVRSGNECKIYNRIASTEELYGVTQLACITVKDYKYIITHEGHTSHDKMWLAIRYYKNPERIKGHKLSEGDIIKLGRLKFRVKRINVHNQHDTEINKITSFLFKQRVVESLDTRKEDSVIESNCRICLSDTNTLENPLISPCKCAGTMKFIHIDCLKHWLRNRVSIKETSELAYYYWKLLDCELCKEVFPSCLNVNGKSYELVNMSKLCMPYVILEDICIDRSSVKGLHVISLKNGALVNIGRGHEAEIRVNDISISRQHAQIKLEKDNFYLNDCKSKFGTLVQIKRSIELDRSGNVCVQVNRTLINFVIEETCTLMTYFLKCRCFGKENSIDSSVFTKEAPKSEERNFELEYGDRHLCSEDNIFQVQQIERRLQNAVQNEQEGIVYPNLNNEIEETL